MVGRTRALMGGVARNVRRGGNGGVMVTSLATVGSAVYDCFMVYRNGSPDRIATVISSIGRCMRGRVGSGPAKVSKLEGTR